MSENFPSSPAKVSPPNTTMNNKEKSPISAMIANLRPRLRIGQKNALEKVNRLLVKELNLPASARVIEAKSARVSDHQHPSLNIIAQTKKMQVNNPQSQIPKSMTKTDNKSYSR